VTEPLDLAAVRARFPILQRRIDGVPITYLDSAATSLRPKEVVDAVVDYETRITANVHRGKHTLSQEASEAFEQARRSVAAFIGAAPREVVFTSGATLGVNLVALGTELPPGSNVVTTQQEHHAMSTPWMGKAQLRVVPVDATGRVDPQRVLDLVDAQTRVVAVSAASNATGAVHDVAAIGAGLRASAATQHVRYLVDAAQLVPHRRIDVRSIGCDYLVFSGHKMLGPTGIGVLWGTHEALSALGTPIRGGGIVDVVAEQSFTTKGVPFRLEPGTPNIAGAIGLGAAVDLLDALDMEAISAHERVLAQRLVGGLLDVPGTRLLGPPPGDERFAIASLVIESKTLAPDHVAMILSDTRKIMVRSGHHCCHPFFDALGTSGSLRLSAYLYNTVDEIDAATAAVREILAGLHA
jgi:cysteine desulfurase / selenocysteine lyase